MGALVGLVIGLGLALIASWWMTPEAPSISRRRNARERSRVPARELGLALGSAAVAGVLVAGVTGAATIGLGVALLASMLPGAIRRARRQRQLRERRAAWPDAVDHLSAAVRAGMSLPEAVAALGRRGPEQLRPYFELFGRDHRESGRFDQALDRLKVRLADPTGDRVVEALRLTRHVGGHDLGRVLRSLSGFLRDDLRTRGEIEARQSWTVNGARIAAAAPWLVLLSMAGRPEVVDRYSTPTGGVIVVGGAVVCAVAYRLMMRIGRLPTERRVFA
ncbi:type II secretion system F family protein [Aeromicrobium sp. Leaf350]|uniref:type II secretion system F family protein n=1 Tax=Aeromicrobium sp. Leaf350 TaxID=2876565 RepID=UPI001E4BE8B5|nr:type II secretion system F family protein [Aeromicrobium sp. Leaf350]